MKFNVLFTLAWSVTVLSSLSAQTGITISNVKPRLDINGEIIDAHDGKVIQFNKTFYWYGTAYGNTSGFVRSNYYQCYSSHNMTDWVKEGPLLINPPSGVYYRPNVIYNKRTKKYILWYNWYPVLWDGKYGVAVSDNPSGPFKIVNTDVRVLYSSMGVGDFGLFVDDDNTAYIEYNTIDGHKGSIEKLNADYLSSSLVNGGFITQGCEAGALFKRNNKYYMVTDRACCFCTQGSGARVYISDNPLGGYNLRNNINRYPGNPAPALVDGNRSPNMYATVKRQKDSLFPAIQLNFDRKTNFNTLKIIFFTGNRWGQCGDTLARQVHNAIISPEFMLLIAKGPDFIPVKTRVTIEKTSVAQTICLQFDPVSSNALLLKPSGSFPYNDLYISEIEVIRDKEPVNARASAEAFINDIDPGKALAVIPAQQTSIMPLKTTKGTEYLWMGDLWGSASDNVKGHDYQYWSNPMKFDENGDILPLRWVDEWKTVLKN